MAAALVAAPCPVLGNTGKVLKVLPHFVDKSGRHTSFPSLYERDAYQAYLRQNPQHRSGLRFDVEWKVKRPVWNVITLRAEVRGIAAAGTTREVLIEKQVRRRTGGWENWDDLFVGSDDYKYLGEVTAWRVTLWEGTELLHERKSFLW